MVQPDMHEILVSVKAIELGVQRVEEKIDALEKKTELSLARLDSEVADHEKWLQRHEVDITVMQQRVGPRISAVTWVAAISAAIALGLAILDRIYLG